MSAPKLRSMMQLQVIGRNSRIQRTRVGGFSLGLREFGGSRIGRREICDSRLGLRELELVGSILEQRELGDSRLIWRELVGFKR